MSVGINCSTHSMPTCWSFVFLKHKWVVTLLALSVQQRTGMSHFNVGGLALWQTEIITSKYHMTIVWMTQAGFFCTASSLFYGEIVKLNSSYLLLRSPLDSWWLLLVLFQGQNGWRVFQTGQGEGFLQRETQTCNWNSESVHFLSQLLLYCLICAFICWLSSSRADPLLFSSPGANCLLPPNTCQGVEETTLNECQCCQL